MTSQVPPPLPDPKSGLRIYLRAGGALVPAMLFWFFANVYLGPKVEQIWHIAGLNGSRVQWLMDASYGFQHHFRFVVAGLVLIILLLEFRWPAWPRYRRTVIAGFTLIFQTAVMLGLTTIAVAVCLAAPLLTKHK